MSACKSDLVDLTLCLHHRTERAILVSDTGERDDAVWLPLAHAEIEQIKGRMVMVTVPEWLALREGLI